MHTPGHIIHIRQTRRGTAKISQTHGINRYDASSAYTTWTWKTIYLAEERPRIHYLGQVEFMWLSATSKYTMNTTEDGWENKGIYPGDAFAWNGRRCSSPMWKQSKELLRRGLPYPHLKAAFTSGELCPDVVDASQEWASGTANEKRPLQLSARQ